MKRFWKSSMLSLMLPFLFTDVKAALFTFLCMLTTLLLQKIMPHLFLSLFMLLLGGSLSRIQDPLIIFSVLKLCLLPLVFFLSQHKYICDLLSKAHMDDAKEVSTPMTTSDSLALHDGSPPTNASWWSSRDRPMISNLTGADFTLHINILSR